MTGKQTQEEIKRLEKAGLFDNHINPTPKDIILPVDENYPYPDMRKWTLKLKQTFEKAVLVKPFTIYQNWFKMRTSYVGRENLKGLKGAVLTCNHITMFDCLAVKHGAWNKRTYVVGAVFNNFKGLLGEMMRAGDMIPLNSTVHGSMNFNKAVRNILTVKNKFLLIYPEQAMWQNYKKPRPYKDGAFNIAVKCNVPVVPHFITFTDTKRLDGEGLVIPKLTVHICKPIYPKQGLSKAENIEYLKESTFTACKNVYENVYKMPLRYDTESQML